MSGYVDPRGFFYPAAQPYLAYGPGISTRFFRSQRAWNGEREQEDYYKSSAEIAGWAAARPFPNLVPFLAQQTQYGNLPPPGFMLPDGPTQPRQLLEQAAVPPTFDAGSYETYVPGRYAPPRPVAPPAAGGGGRGGGPALTVEDFAAATAMGLKRILPELATAQAVQAARAQAKFAHPRPANIDPPIRAWEFNDCQPTPVVVTDAAFVLIVEHLVPVGTIAVANQLLVEAESPAALEDTEIRVLVGGIPHPRYGSLNCPDLGQNGLPAVTNIKAIEQQRITVQARSRTVGAVHRVTGMLRGWDSAPSHMTNLDSVDGWRGR